MAKVKGIRSPIKWAGGKFRLRKKIIEILPPHDCYVEVFGGAGWVLFGKEKSNVEIFNDIDSELVNFFRVVKSNPKRLIKKFDFNLVSRNEFNRLAKLDPTKLSDIERAHRFYYIVMASWGGELKGPRFQTSISDNGHGNRLIGGINTIKERILPAHQRLQTVIIENLTWQECIARYDRPYKTNKVVMFIDPPYPGNNVNYFHNMSDIKHHQELISILESVKANIVLTSFDLPDVRKLYNPDKFNIMSVEFAGGMPTATTNSKKSRNREIIVTNFDF